MIRQTRRHGGRPLLPLPSALRTPVDEGEAQTNTDAIALLDEWLAENQAVSPEEREEANREWAQFQTDLESHPVSVRIPKLD